MPTYVRVRDTSTRHEFDVIKGHPKIGKGLEDITSDRWPVLDGPQAQPRPALHHTDKAGQPDPSPAGTPAPKSAPAASTAKGA